MHLTEATDEEAALIARRGARMALCSGSIGIIDGVVPPARAFGEAGGLVALGSDQACGNNCNNLCAVWPPCRLEGEPTLPDTSTVRKR